LAKEPICSGGKKTSNGKSVAGNRKEKRNQFLARQQTGMGADVEKNTQKRTLEYSNHTKREEVKGERWGKYDV